MKVLTLDLLRHGEAEGADRYRGRSDPPLTPAGERQMLAWVRHAESWQRILCSPLRRCREPAERLASALGLPLGGEPALAEYDFGDWDGQRYEEVWQRDPERVLAFWRDPAAHPPPGGERIADLCDRIAALERHLAEQDAGSLLLVTHGGVIRALIGRHLGISPSGWSQLRIDTGSLSRVKIGYDREGGWFELAFMNRLPPAGPAG